MTWKELKKAIEDSGVKDVDEICCIECRFQNGDKTLHKSQMGRAIKLSEGISEKSNDYKGCAT